jgi:hypothetical protein
MTLAGLILLACSTPQIDVPPELVGRWTTDDERFDGRAMEFTSQSVTFETGIEPPTMHAVVAIDSDETAGSERAMIIRYLGEGGGESTLTLRYDTSTQTVRLENRRDVLWTRGNGR